MKGKDPTYNPRGGGRGGVRFEFLDSHKKKHCADEPTYPPLKENKTLQDKRDATPKVNFLFWTTTQPPQFDVHATCMHAHTNVALKLFRCVYKLD